MHKITFFPIGNADCCKIDLDCGKKMLFDYACYEKANEEDKRIDLKSVLKDELEEENKDSFDVVGFTHADDDHIHAASEFFYFEHAQKYQDDDRIKITELWVPAAFIIEENLENDARVIRAEARYRLKQGKGIKVFSRPEKLKAWLEQEGIDPEERKNLFVDAGKIVPGLSLETEGVEFFVHSPFASRNDQGELIDRNADSLIFHVTFSYEGYETKFLLIGDTDYTVLKDIVNITCYHKREDRLSWDIFDIPHHCSYLALNEEKGKEKTEPLSEIQWLLSQGNNGGYLISCSKPIPTNDDDPQPPHRQAANCYKDYATSNGCEFKVTMEYPKESNPEPIIIKIDEWKASLKKTITYGSATIISNQAPRAGKKQ